MINIKRINKNKSKKSRASENFGSRGPITRSMSNVSATPDSIRVQLRYVDNFNKLNGAGTTVFQVYKINSVFDPDYTNAGHQPLSFDQWATLYSKYRVLGCKWKISGLNADKIGSVMTVTPSLTDANDTNFYDQAEEPRSKTVMISGEKPGVLTGSITTRELFGLTESQFGADTYAALTGFDPSNVGYLHIAVRDGGGGNFTNGVDLLIELEYDVQFLERKELDASFWTEASKFEKACHHSTTKGEKPILDLEILKQDFQLSIPSSASNTLRPSPISKEGREMLRVLL